MAHRRKAKQTHREEPNELAGLVALVIIGAYLFSNAVSSGWLKVGTGDYMIVVAMLIGGTLAVALSVYLVLRERSNKRKEATRAEAERLAKIERERKEQESLARRALLQRSIVRTSELDPTDFEKEVAFVFSVLSPFRVEHCGGAGDGGIDVRLFDKASGELKGIVQAKRYAPNYTLPPAHLRDFAHCKQDTNVEFAYLVTTARLSDKSSEDARRWGIRIIDGAQFEKQRDKAYKANAQKAVTSETPIKLQSETTLDQALI